MHASLGPPRADGNGQAPGKVAVVTTSPLCKQAFLRMAGDALSLYIRANPDELILLKDEVDIVLIQDDFEPEADAESRIASALKYCPSGIPLIAFSRHAHAKARALAQRASGFLRMPCRAEDFWSLINTWHTMRQRSSRPSDAARPPAPVAAKGLDAPQQQSATTILLVDDSTVIHSFVEAALQGSGYTLLHAFDGLQGLEAARAQVPDLVISDIDMPNLDGFGMCRRLRQDPITQAVPILILSARGKGVDVDHSFDVGANDFLSKPVSENEFLSRVEQMLSARRAGEHRREQILVVDDSPTHRAVITQALAQQGFGVTNAADGNDALALLEHAAPDLVITDSEMPQLDGRQLTRELKSRPRFRDVPVVMLTAADSPLNRIKSKQAGIAAYLTKPFVPDKLVALVERLLADRRLHPTAPVDAQTNAGSRSLSAAAPAPVAAEPGKEPRCEIRFVTLLHADIAGFMSLAERLVPEDLVALLNAYFDEMLPLIQAQGGIVNQLVGDSIVAMFGSEAATSAADEATSAIQAALAMQAALASFNRSRPEAVQLRIVLHSGPVILGDLGSPLHRREYSAVGENVLVATGLKSSARAGAVVISQATFDLVRGRFVTEPLGTAKVKGKSTAVELHLVQAPTAGLAG